MSEQDELGRFLAHAAAAVEGRLRTALPSPDQPPVRLHEAMHYALFGGGKRLRPALVLASCATLGGEEEQALNVAAAFELVHTYSLVHDDLPCMDDDDLRRGRPTCHKVYGEALALLVGDGLLTAAFEIALAQGTDPACGRILARVAGSVGMVGGQVLDLEGEGGESDLELVRRIHTLKTAALISGALEAGAVVAGADGAVQAAFAKAGEAMGLGFQIRDDLLDETADAGTLGKTPGKDRRSGKQTWPACVGLELSREEAQGQVERGLDLLAGVGVREGILVELCNFMVARSR